MVPEERPGGNRLAFEIEDPQPVDPPARPTSTGEAKIRLLLCVFVILIGIYLQISLKIAESVKTFDIAGLVINVGIISALIACGIAAQQGELHTMFEDGWWRKALSFALPGVGFCLTQYLTIVALLFLEADVQKVINQLQLLVVAFISVPMMGRKYSALEWVAMIVVVLACCSYTATGWLVGNSGEESGKSFGLLIVGICINLTSNVIQGYLSIKTEKLLKGAKNTPFYIQKFYLEIWTILFGMILSGPINPMFVFVLKNLSSEMGVPISDSLVKPLEGSWFKHPFGGLEYKIIWVVIVLQCLKSWVAGMLVKKISSVSKQLCSAVTVGLMYFAKLIHLSGGNGEFQFRLNGLKNMSFAMVLADLTVLMAVVGTVLAGKKQHELDTAKQALLDSRVQDKACVEASSGA